MNDVLFRSSPQRSTPVCLLAALDFLARGWSPIALCPADHAGVDAAHERLCNAPGGTPLWSWKEYQQRLPSERELHVYWNRNPEANVGIVLGPVSGLVALLFDGPQGEELRRRPGSEALPETLEIMGAAGSRRLLYSLPPRFVVHPLALAVPALPDGLSCLAAGEHLPVPPSRRAGGGACIWRLGRSPDECSAAPAPRWLIDYLVSEDRSAVPTPWSEAVAAPVAAPQPVEPAAPAARPQNGEPAVMPVPRAADPVPRDAAQDVGPHIIVLSAVKAAPPQWLWPGWIPLGKLVVLDGDPGLGKSTLLLDLAARITRGLPLPDGAAGMTGGVTLLTAEDSLTDTVRPRLEVAGADLDRVHAFSSIGEPNGGNRPPIIPHDLDVLRQIVKNSSSRLLIIDPFLAYLGGSVDSCNDQDVRRCLHRLAELAEEAACAVVLLRHLTKLATGRAVYRGQGSIGIIGAARAGLLVGRDPDAESHRILACTKSNLAASPASLRYTLEPVIANICRVVWCGASAYQADDLIQQPETPDERLMTKDAQQFLRTVLGDGPVAADECLRQAREVNISERTLRRAKTRLKVQSIKEGVGALGQWLWQLP